ncbi:MAG: TIGR00266 family protein [Desulfurococcaceae archaeon]
MGIVVQYRVDKGPAYSILKLQLSPGESVTIEPGSYMMHRGEVKINTSSLGVKSGLARVLAGGESFFLNTFMAQSNAEIWAAPSIPGDIAAVELNKDEILIQDTSYLGHIGNITLTVGWRGLKGLIAEGELIWLKAAGEGIVFLNSYGAIEEINIPSGEAFVIDNGHFVALEGRVSWSIKKLGGLKTLFLGGEGLVVETKGPGRVWIQSRNLPMFAQILGKFIPSKK